MGTLVIWCKHCQTAVRHEQDDSFEGVQDRYIGVCASCARKYDKLKPKDPRSPSPTAEALDLKSIQ